MRSLRWTLFTLLLATTVLIVLPPARASAQNFTYCGPIDVVFVVDESPTSVATLNNLRTGTPVNAPTAAMMGILTDIEHSCDPETGQGTDYRLALVTFRDDVTVKLNFSPQNRAAFEAALGTLAPGASGTGNANASDEALRTIIGAMPASARPAGKQTGDFSELFRSTVHGNVAVRKAIVLLSDTAPGGFDGAYDPAVDLPNAHQRALDAAAKGIKIVGIWSPTNANDPQDTIGIMQDYATTTGGWFSRTDEPSPPFPMALTFPTTLLQWYFTNPSSPYGGGCTPVNRPPIAGCGDDFQMAGPSCEAVAGSVVDAWNTWDWEDDAALLPLTVTQAPPGPYFPGATLVTVTATDSAGASSTCQGTVNVDYGHCTPPAPVATSIAASPPKQAAYGTPIAWTVAATGGIQPLQYEFWRTCDAHPGWALVQPYSTSPSYTWTPQASDVGLCYVHTRVRSAGSFVAYESYINSAAVNVQCFNPPKLQSVTPSPSLPVQAGATIIWTPTTTGGAGAIEYEYWRYSYSSGVWTKVQDYGVATTFTWVTGPGDVGQYALHVRVRDTNAVHPVSPFESYIDTSPFTITSAAPAQITQVSVAPASPQPYTTAITWTPTGTGGVAPLQYQFWRYCTASPGWQMVQDYGAGTSYTWTPGDAGFVGLCFLHVRVRSSASTQPFEGYFDTAGYQITRPIAIALTSVTASPSLPVQYGNAITWTATASPAGAYEYQFWRYSKAEGAWSLVRDYLADATYTWTPTSAEAGIYGLHARVRSAGSTLVYEHYFNTPMFAITASPPATLTSFSPSAVSGVVNTPVTWTAVGAVLNGIPEYQFWQYNSTTGAWTLLQDFSPVAFVAWTPTQAGTYQFQVQVRRQGSSLPFESYLRSADFVVVP